MLGNMCTPQKRICALEGVCEYGIVLLSWKRSMAGLDVTWLSCCSRNYTVAKAAHMRCCRQHIRIAKPGGTFRGYTMGLMFGAGCTATGDKFMRTEEYQCALDTQSQHGVL